MLNWKGQKIDRKQHVIVIHEMQKTIFKISLSQLYCICTS